MKFRTPAICVNDLRALLAMVALSSGSWLWAATPNWKGVLSQPEDWYGSEEAVRLADTVLLYQTDSGGWPKNTEMTEPPGDAYGKRSDSERAPTIDNSATTRPLLFLAQVHAANSDSRWAESLQRGLNYLLDAQYPNGGWPQFYPLRKGYYSHITYNDDAMVNVLELLRSVERREEEWTWVDPTMRQRVSSALARGIACILATQVRVEGQLTVWCAQHDEISLRPASARAYELVSLSGAESVGIVRFLMGIEDPSSEVEAAIQASVAWFRRAAIPGKRVEFPKDEQAKSVDQILVDDPKVDSWARFYEIGSDRPIFVGRSSEIHYTLAEVEQERRAGYRYYGGWAKDLIGKEWQAWRRRLASRSKDSVSSLVAVPSYVPVDVSSQWSQSLNGQWAFMLDGPEKEFYETDFDDGAWKQISVPSNWELEGFEEPRYKEPAENVGLYRRTFDTPSNWKGRRVIIRFEGVLFGFEFWVNGQSVGSFESAFNRSDFDITEFLAPAGKNTLAVRVYRRFKGWQFDTFDAWGISGIYRDVSLFSVPETHFKDLTIVTNVAPDLASARIECRVDLKDRSSRAKNLDIRGLLLKPDGSILKAVSKTPSLTNGEASTELSFAVNRPQLWNAETPELYTLKLELLEKGEVLHTVERKVGIREITIEGDVLKLNHHAIKMRGVNRHDIHPEVGRANRREHYLEDIELMKKGNINAVRTSHYPPHPMFLDLCDQFGIYVVCEVPFGFGDSNLGDPSYQNILFARADATVARDKNHPSVLIWSVGNENPVTPIVVKTADRVKELDPSRFRLLPGAQGTPEEKAKLGADLTEFAEKTKFIFNLPDSVEIAAPHYPYVVEIPERDRKINLMDLARDPHITRPVICTEYNHSLGSSFEGLKEHWEMFEEYDRLGGAFIWNWSDQGIRRKVAGRKVLTHPADRLLVSWKETTVSGDVWIDAGTVLDSHGGSGSDGIVYADRFPQADYWLTRRVYSQVVMPEDEATARVGRQSLSLDILNRFDFTNLRELKGEWRLSGDNRIFQKGTLKLDVPARGKGKARIDFDLAEGSLGRDLRLDFAFTDSKGREIYEHAVRLIPESGPVNFADRLERGFGQKNELLRPQYKGAATFVKCGDFEWKIGEQSGQVVARNTKTGAVVLEGPLVRVGRQAAMSEWRNYPRYDLRFWEDPFLENPQASAFTSRILKDGSVELSWTARYLKEGATFKGPLIEAAFKVVMSPQGWVDVDYELTPHGAKDHFLEFGLAFRLPQESNQLTWLGDGPYNSYPGQSEAAERGVWNIRSLPVENPHGRYYEGNRVKVDLAAVTNEKGNGFGVVCDRSTLSMEKTDSGMIFSQILRVAGKGNKTGGMLTLLPVPASDVKTEKGSLRIVPLTSGRWPTPFADVLESTFKEQP
jgi:beta-galactosidase